MQGSEQTDRRTFGEAIRASTRSLLERYRLGKHSALERLLQRETPELRRWARGKLPRWARAVVDTGDLVQDTLARAVPHLSRFESRHRRALQFYLRSAVENRIRDELRRVGRTPPLEPVDDPAAGERLAGREPSPLDVLLEAERDALFTRALADSSETDRQAIVARLRLGYSYEQIALVLGKRSADSARMTVTRAIERLARRLDELASGQ
jgi:RNA polymerase sigma-70 factor (ECF subfamily)